MSGEPIVILPGEAMARLVRAAAKLAAAPLGRYAIIGGVAVSARLQRAHRATADLDTVVDDAKPPPAIETLLNLPGAKPDPTGAHRVLIDGIKIEVQGTGPFDAQDLDGLTDKQVLYVSAHRYALDSASLVTLVAQAGHERATVPVATPGALIAMKLHAIEDRRAGGAIDKRAGDAWDMYRILIDLDGGGVVRDELRALPEVFCQVVRSAAERILVRHAARTISWLKFGDDRMAAITADELNAVGQPLVEALLSAT